MTTATAKSSEPTIDDILASIRRIIADDQQAEETAPVPRVVAAAPESDEDVLDLAQPVLRPAHPPRTPAPAAEAPPTLTPNDGVTGMIQPKPAEPAAMNLRPVQPANDAKRPAEAKSLPLNGSQTDSGARLERLIAGDAEEALSAAFGRISALKVSAETKTLEGLVADLLRPMLKEWLDANLPAIAERLVKREIERIAAQSGR